uniref:Uncharacterized protein n=1 Tax=Cacopsylla melanoneura TaxID=428564 RepID=A0A8D8LT07_9HEMI
MGPKSAAISLPNLISTHLSLSSCPLVLSAMPTISSFDTFKALIISSLLECCWRISLTVSQGKGSSLVGSSFRIQYIPQNLLTFFSSSLNHILSSWVTGLDNAT